MQPSSSASVLSTIALPLLRRYKSFTPGDLRSETQAQHYQQSHCLLEKNSDDTFERAFLSPRALQLAFGDCQPMIILDACHLRSKYGGVVMSAVAHDEEGKLSKPGIVVMHDREKGLQNAQKLVLPNSYKSILRLPPRKKPNKEAGAYLLRSDTTKWASAYFPTARYGTVTSNSAESMNSWLEPLRSGSHLNFFNNWLSKVAELMFSRNKSYNNLSSEIPENIQRRFNENKRKGLQRQIHQFAEFGFEVVNQANGHKRIINLALKTCTFPGEIVLPPAITRRAGRPKSRQIRSRGETNFEDQYTCTVCGIKGHNRRTCSNKHVQLTSIESLQTEKIDISRRVEVADSREYSLIFSTPALQSSGMSSKRIRTSNQIHETHASHTPFRHRAGGATSQFSQLPQGDPGGISTMWIDTAQYTTCKKSDNPC
ncbi:hypothetical protein BASA61_003886 [Batrachochytrium salamandrivorans]|nr:hypothetical protein BASA61_003886 [Batrachochytrium salamandrivorans]